MNLIGCLKSRPMKIKILITFSYLLLSLGAEASWDTVKVDAVKALFDSAGNFYVNEKSYNVKYYIASYRGHSHQKPYEKSLGHIKRSSHLLNIKMMLKVYLSNSILWKNLLWP